MDTNAAIDSVGGWPGVLNQLAEGKSLTTRQCQAAMADILADRATDAQIAGLIVALRIKGETADELVGFTTAMLDAAKPLTLPPGTVDIVGTGGSSRRIRYALNVSTMASIVAAASGVTVCKHGNKRASSTSGSFDFLETLGVGIQISPEKLESCLQTVGLGFAFARIFHPAMRLVGPSRAQLGIPTVFNVLGPLAHPGRPSYQVIGTSSVELGAKMAEAVQKLGVTRAWVVTGSGGYDELTLTGPSHVWDVSSEGISEQMISAKDAGLPHAESVEALAGGTGADNVRIFSEIASGQERGPKRDIVVLNAAAALVVAGKADDLGAAVSMAVESIDAGRVSEKVDRLRAATAG